MTAPTLIQYNNYVSEKLTTRTPKVLFNTTQTNQDYIYYRTALRRILPHDDGDMKFGNRIIKDVPENWGMGQMNHIMRRAQLAYYGTRVGEGPLPGFIYDTEADGGAGGFVMYSGEFQPARDYGMTANEGNYTNIDFINKLAYRTSSRTQGDRIRGLKLQASQRSYRASKR